MYVFILVRKRVVICMRCWFCLILPVQGVTRHLDVECFESAVPAIFLSYAPTFLGFILFVEIQKKYCACRMVCFCASLFPFILTNKKSSKHFLHVYKGRNKEKLRNNYSKNSGSYKSDLFTDRICIWAVKTERYVHKILHHSYIFRQCKTSIDKFSLEWNL